jgi:hypothetical protein
MGDWNEWEDMKDTIVNEHRFLDPSKKHKSVNKDKDDNQLEPTNKYVYTKIVDDVKRRITMYSSNYVGGWAVNAITNVPYNIRIGSTNEQYLFTVRFSARKFPGRENDVITLYYDSPYLYERHHYVSLRPSVIDSWQAKFNALHQRVLGDTSRPSATIPEKRDN